MSKCSICGFVIGDEDEIVATTHFISDEDDPLWRFSDSAMHKSCFLNWQHKQDFIDKFNDTLEKIVFGSGTSHKMEIYGRISVLKKED